jgi:predicted RNA-binding protein with RPS1 domain
LSIPARGNLASRNQNIGIKVLDIKDQPLSVKDARKRKKEEEEKEKKVGASCRRQELSMSDTKD